MEFAYTRRQRLVIELMNNQIFEGDCEKCTKDRIDMVNIIEYPKGQKLKELLSFYRCEIVSVRVVNEDIESTEEPTGAQQSRAIKHEDLQSSCEVIALTKTQYQRLKDMSLNYTYMATIDRRYLDAVNHLNNCENIGVHGVGSQFGRHRAISLLVLSSWNQVYIFDLLLYRNRFPPDLKIILETDEIQKVVHDSRTLVDCLWHRYGIKLKNVFDTQVADSAVERKQNECVLQKPRNLSECLASHFNFPLAFLDSAMVGLKEWEERPLSDSQKIKAAQCVTYLITLKNKLEKTLLQEYYDCVETHSNKLVVLDGCAVRTSLKSMFSSRKETEEVLQD